MIMNANNEISKLIIILPSISLVLKLLNIFLLSKIFKINAHKIIMFNKNSIKISYIRFFFDKIGRFMIRINIKMPLILKIVIKIINGF